MANFPTHIAVGTIVSGALATVTVAADMVAPENLVAVTLAGVLGSVLPDIDLKDSRPSRAMFAGLGVFFSFAVLFSLERKYSIAEMLILWLGTLVVVRYVAKAVFFHFSYHRGIWHSLLATVFCAFLTRLDLQHAARPQRGRGVARRRLHGHRLSHPPDARRDLLRRRDGYAHQGLVRHGAEAGGLQAPRPLRGHGRGHRARLSADAADRSMFVESITSRALWTSLQQRLLPQDKWFGVDWRGTAWLPDMPFRAKAKTEAAPAAAQPDLDRLDRAGPPRRTGREAKDR